CRKVARVAPFPIRRPRPGRRCHGRRPRLRLSSIGRRPASRLSILVGRAWFNSFSVLIDKKFHLGAGVVVAVDTKKNIPVFFRDSIPLDLVASTVQSFSGFEIESEGVLATTDHLVPNIAFFQRRSLVRAPSLNGIKDAGAAQNQYVFPIGQLGRKEAFLFQRGKLSDKKILHRFAPARILALESMIS